MRLAAAITALALLADPLSAQQPAPVSASARALHELQEEYWQWRLREYPEGSTWLGDKRYNDRLTDLSAAAIERRKADTRRVRDRARAIQGASLPGQDGLSLALLQWELDLAVEGQRFPTEVMMLDQLDGPQLGFPQLASISPFETVEDYRAYLARLAPYPRYLEQVTALLRSGIARGWVQPNG